MRFIKFWQALLLFLCCNNYLVASYTSRSDIGSNNGFQTSLATAASGPIRGLFQFTAGLTLGANGMLWQGIGGGVGSIFNFSSSYTLTLANDIHLAPNTIVTADSNSIINIDGNGSNHSIFLDGENIIFAKPLRVSNVPLTLDGLGHTCTIRSGTYFSTRNSNGGTLTLADMTILTQNSSYMFTNTFTGSSANPTLRNLTIRPIKGGQRNLFDGSGSNTGITIVGDVRIEGPGSILNFGSNVTIAANSSLYIGPGVSVCGIGLGGVAGTPAVGITMTDATSTLYLDGCDFYTGVYGVQILKGTVLLGNKTRIYNGNYTSFIANTNMANGLVFGDGTAANDVDVYVLGSAYVEALGCIFYKHS